MNLALSAVFWGVITFSILIVLHEGGHFIAARLFGVKVHEFMLGLPGPAIRFHGKQTDYGITAIPLGGYVRIAGMEPGPENPLLGTVLQFVTRLREADTASVAQGLDITLLQADAALLTLSDWAGVQQVPGTEDHFRALFPAEDADDAEALLAKARSRTFRGLSTSKRIAVLSAGVLVNLVSAILVFTVVLSIWGYPRASLTLAGVRQGSGALAAGIHKGDTLVAVEGAKLATWDDLVLRISQRSPGDTVKLTYLRGGKSAVAQVKLGRGPSGRAILGVESGVEHVKPTVLQAFDQSFHYLVLTFTAIGGFFNPATFKQSVSMSHSVIGVSVEVARYVNYGALAYAQLVAALSLGLGALNILPIPPLDGGKVAMEVIERVYGRPLPRNLSLGLSATGTLVLFALIGYLMYADVVRYVIRGG
jgi:regulator of sigma E protease